METIALDFETYFDDTYTLKKLPTEAYVRNSNFQPHVLGIYRPDKPDAPKGAIGLDGINRLVRDIPWHNVRAIAHHAQFDGFILWHHFGVRPAQWCCTLSMARTQSRDRVGERLSLEALAANIGKTPKTVDYVAFKGRRTEQLTEGQLKTLLDQCYDDCQLAYDCFDYLMHECSFPAEELIVVDATVRMFTEPVLVGNSRLFDKLAATELKRKTDLLSKLGLNRGDLASTNKFAALLSERGITIETKPGKRGPIPALAKTDSFSERLRNGPDQEIRDFIDARFDIKSTIEETRAARFARVSERGPLPVYLRYCAAHTTRWGGGDATNWQNFPRKGGLRDGIAAPAGYKLLIKDYAQIEARLLLACANQKKQLQQFADGIDLYVEQAAEIYRKKTEDITKAERGLGKLLVLSGGFGASEYSIMRTAKLGTYGPKIILTEKEARDAKINYRDNNYNIEKFWKYCGGLLRCMLVNNHEAPIKLQNVDVTIIGRYVHLPNGLKLDYSGLSRDPDGTLWLRFRYETFKIWGSKFVENLIQALARVVLSQAIVRIMLDSELIAMGVKLVLTVHDELVFVVPDEHVEAASAKIDMHMLKQPPWLTTVSLAVDTTVSSHYQKG